MEQPKIFISYSHLDADRKWLAQFVRALEQQGVSVWFDEADVLPGESIADAMESALRESDMIVVLLTAEYARSPNLFFELGVALGSHKRIVPILSEDVDVSQFPFDLRVRQHIAKGPAEETALRLAAIAKAASKAIIGRHETHLRHRNGFTLH